VRGQRRYKIQCNPPFRYRHRNISSIISRNDDLPFRVSNEKGRANHIEMTVRYLENDAGNLSAGKIQPKSRHQSSVSFAQGHTHAARRSERAKISSLSTCSTNYRQLQVSALPSHCMNTGRYSILILNIIVLQVSALFCAVDRESTFARCQDHVLLRARK
jgi:hypothetical protein